MLDEEFATIIGAGDRQRVFAQACLDLFEKDRGRPAYAMLEIRNWADVQIPKICDSEYCVACEPTRIGPKRANDSGTTDRHHWSRGRH